MRKKILSFFLIMILVIATLFTTVYASSESDSDTGLSISIKTDKDSYKKGESIDVEVIIKNISAYTYKNLNYEITLPDGVTAPKSAKLSGAFAVSSGLSKTVAFKTEGATIDANSEGNGNDNSNNSGMNPIIFVIIGGVLVVVAIVIIIITKKKGKGKPTGKTPDAGTAATLLLVILAASCFGTLTSDAAPSLKDYILEETKEIKIDGKAQKIIVKITGEKAEAALNVTNIGIHDPSIFYDPVSGDYYSYGSHIVAGKSSNLISWNYISSSSSAYSVSNQLFSKHYLEEFKEVYDWLGADVIEGIWALDVTYSQAAADAGNDPYFMYVTVTDATRDALCLATAAKPEGPFKYKEMIVCSDFRESEVADGSVNLLDILGVDSVSDLTAEQKNYYITSDKNEYRSKFPQCIDAAPYYDGDGNMYLAYGSFSSTGALHVLKLDPLTGLRAKDNYTYNPSELQDPYYGRQIAVKRGEGPYVLTVKSDKSSTGYYYFLFWSQGVLSATGGYNMRMLRSEYPDRGFEDYAGNSAMDKSVVGVRIMDNFMFTSMNYSSTANGGNSAIVTKDGQIFLHYHSKSAHSAAYGENGFIIKSNQMFLNEDGWLVTTPYKYFGETMTELSKNDVVGDYEFIYHTLKSVAHPAVFEDNYVSSEFLRLNDDGTVSGSYTGTWELDKNYFTIKLGDKEYKGVVLEQYDESTTRTKTVVFTAEGSDNRTVWGSKIYYDDEKRTSVDSLYLSVTNTADSDFTLDTTGRLNSSITWASNNDAIVIDGSNALVVPQDSDQTVTLTATIKFGDAQTTKEFTVTVPAEDLKLPTTVSGNTITLPTKTAAGKTITWTSSDVSVIDPATGKVNVPTGSGVKVTLTGAVEGSDRVITHEVSVMALPTAAVYSENYDSLASLSASVENSLWYSKNAADALTLQNGANGGKYVQFAPGSANSRGAVSTFEAAGQVDGVYVLDFDLALTAGDNQATEFAVTTEKMAYLNNVINDGIGGGYLFKLSANASSTTWAINDGDTFEIAAGQWIHINAIADTDTGLVTLTITNGDTELYSGNVEMNGAGKLRGFYIRGGRYHSVTCVDNVTIKKN